jgi:transmembrane sensor
MVHAESRDSVRVVVTSGAVLMQPVSGPEDRGVVLHPGDVGVMLGDGRTEVHRNTSTADDLAWTRGQLVFRDAPLAVVRAELRRWYGVELRVADTSLLSKHLNATFAGESLEEMLKTLSLILEASVERRGDTVVVRAAPPRR